MKFRQTWGRKLASLLSAVMILSTITPATVPALAAAPDEVQVDSLTEQALAETGSEELFGASDISSVDEEADFLAEDPAALNEVSDELAESAADGLAEELMGSDDGVFAEGDGGTQQNIDIRLDGGIKYVYYQEYDGSTKVGSEKLAAMGGNPPLDANFDVTTGRRVEIRIVLDVEKPYLFLDKVERYFIPENIRTSVTAVPVLEKPDEFICDLGVMDEGRARYYDITTKTYQINEWNKDNKGNVTHSDSVFDIKALNEPSIYDFDAAWFYGDVSYVRDDDTVWTYDEDLTDEMWENSKTIRILLNRSDDTNNVGCHLGSEPRSNEDGTRVNTISSDNASAEYMNKAGNKASVSINVDCDLTDEWWKRDASIATINFGRKEIQNFFENRREGTRLTVKLKQIQQEVSQNFEFKEKKNIYLSAAVPAGSERRFEYISVGYSNLGIKVVSDNGFTASIDTENKIITVSCDAGLSRKNNTVEIVDSSLDPSHKNYVVATLYVWNVFPQIRDVIPTVEVVDTSNEFIFLKVGIKDYDKIEKIPGTYYYYWAEITPNDEVSSNVLRGHNWFWNGYHYANEIYNIWPIDILKDGVDRNAGTAGMTYNIKVYAALYDQEVDAVKDNRPMIDMSEAFAVATSGMTKRARDFKFYDNNKKDLKTEMPVGSSKQFMFSASGCENLEIKPSEDNDITASINPINNTVSVKAGINSKGQKNKFTIIDKCKAWTYNSQFDREVATIEISSEIQTVLSANVTVDAGDMTHNSISLKLGINDALKKIVGLNYKIEVTSKSDPGEYLIDHKSVQVPVSEIGSGLYDLDLRKNENVGMYSGTAGIVYDVKVSLVQYDGAGNVIVTSKTTDATSGATKEISNEKYETKLKISKSNNKDNPKKIYNNMTKDTPFKIDVTYSSTTTVKKLERVELIDQDGNIKDYWTVTRPGSSEKGREALFLTVNESNSEISFFPNRNGSSATVYIIGKGALSAGKYTIKAYAYEPLGTEVSAKIVVTVENGIVSGYNRNDPNISYYNPDYLLSVSPMDNTCIYKKDNNPATLQMTAYVGPKKTGSVLWSVNSADPELNSAVTIKSGKLTIDKKYKGSGELTVTVKANDWAGNESFVSRRICVYQAKSASSNILLKNNTRGFTVESDKSYYVNDFFENREQYDYGYVAQFTAYDNMSSYVPIKSFGVGGAAKLIKYDAATATAYIAFVKPGKVTLKGTADDGSGRTFKIVFTIKGGDLEPTGLASGTEAFKYRLTGLKPDGTTGNIVASNRRSETGNGVNYGAPGQPMLLEVSSLYNNTETGTDNTTTTYIDSKLGKVVGASVKAVKNHPGQYTVTPTKENSSIIIRYGVKFTKEMKIEFKNNAFSSGKLKVTPENMVNGKVQKGRIYNNIDFSETSVGKFKKYDALDAKTHKPNTVTFTLDTDAEVNAVMVEVTNNTKLDTGVVREMVNKKKLNDGTEFAIHKLLNKKFTIDFIDEGTGKFNVKKGSYQLVITAGNWDMTKHVFTAASKSVKVKINAAPAAKSAVKDSANLRFADGGAANVAAAELKEIVPRNYIGNVKYGVNKNEETVSLRNVNIGGNMNYFSYNFEIKGDKIFFKGGHNKSIDPSVKADKPELSGYISYTYQQLDGRVVTTYIKGTVKLNSKKILGTK